MSWRRDIENILVKLNDKSEHFLTSANFADCEDCGCLIFKTEENLEEIKLVKNVDRNGYTYNTERRIYKCKRCRLERKISKIKR